MNLIFKFKTEFECRILKLLEYSSKLSESVYKRIILGECAYSYSQTVSTMRNGVAAVYNN
jgi:hypothetical protein